MTIAQGKGWTMQHVSCPAANASTREFHVFLNETKFSRGSGRRKWQPVESIRRSTIGFKSRKIWSIAKRLAILGHFQQVNDGGEIMIHLIWYIVVGLIAGVIAKSVMHVHMTIFWTIVLGIIGSIIGGAVTHMFSPPTTGRFHPAGLIFSTLGAILVLYVCIKLNIRFPRVL
jgi:uncharacterized membrane protein YeaQ/YmgE (transglycosylase-associated protein family)